MKKLFFFLLVLGLPSCGDIGSSSTNVNSESQSIFDPVPTDVTTVCSIDDDGTITASQTVEGGTVNVVPISSLDDCDFISEAKDAIEEANEDEEDTEFDLGEGVL